MLAAAIPEQPPERGKSVNKDTLRDYMDACELVAEIERDIRKLERKEKEIVHGCVRGSNPVFPYEPKHFQIEGISYSPELERKLSRERHLLKERKEYAESVKNRVEEELLHAPMRIQRMIRYKYFEGNSWEEVARRMGRKATAESVRKEVERYLMEENNEKT